MTLYVTYCSKEKKESESDLPAMERYQSERIEQIYQESLNDGEDFAILSGKYGLVKPDEHIPYYDKLLEEDDLEDIASEVEEFLEEEQVSEVVYFTRPWNGVRRRYYDCVRKACEELNIEIETTIID